MIRFRLAPLALLLALLLPLAGCDQTPDPPPEPVANPDNAVYVCNQAGATVSIIDPATHEVVATLDLTQYGFSATAKPHDVAVEPDGSAWYVSLIGDDAVAKFDDENNLIGRVSFPSPGMLSLHPTSNLLYAGHTMSIPDVPRTVAVIDRAAMAPVEVPLAVPIDRPHGMKVSPTGDYAYSSSLSSNRIVAIDTETQEVQSPVSLPGSRQRYVQLDIAADGQTAFVTGQVAGQVQVLDLQNPTAPTLTDSVDVGGEPWHPQLSADGSTLYFGSKATDAVYAMDTATLDTTAIRGTGLANPHGSTLSPDGDWVYISNANVNGRYTPSSGDDVGTVVAIDAKTQQIEHVIEVGAEPAGIDTR
jgi:YVTN family beta-propeller protein